MFPDPSTSPVQYTTTLSIDPEAVCYSDENSYSISTIARTHTLAKIDAAYQETQHPHGGGNSTCSSLHVSTGSRYSLRYTIPTIIRIHFLVKIL